MKVTFLLIVLLVFAIFLSGCTKGGQNKEVPPAQIDCNAKNSCEEKPFACIDTCNFQNPEMYSLLFLLQKQGFQQPKVVNLVYYKDFPNYSNANLPNWSGHKFYFLVYEPTDLNFSEIDWREYKEEFIKMYGEDMLNANTKLVEFKGKKQLAVIIKQEESKIIFNDVNYGMGGFRQDYYYNNLRTADKFISLIKEKAKETKYQYNRYTAGYAGFGDFEITTD